MHTYYWETVETEPTKHVLSVSWGERQHNLVLTSADSKEDVIKKRVEYVGELESA